MSDEVDVVGGSRAVPARRVDLDGLAALEEERRFLLRSIADLEREHAAGDLDDADYLELKDGYTARAAAVLRAIHAGRSRLPAPRRRPGGRSRVVGAAVVVLLLAGLTGVLIARAADPRLDGETATGDITTSTNQLLSRARLLQATDPLESIKLYDQVLETDPDQVEALTYRGWLLLLVGDPSLQADGEAFLDRAIAADPTYPDAHVFKGIVLLRIHGDVEAARAQFDLVLASPDVPADMRNLVSQTLAQMDQAPQPSSTTVP